MINRILSALVALLCAATAFGGFVIHNEDCTQYFIEESFPADEAGARKYLARYLEAGSENLKILMLNPQGQMASYDSKVLRPAWSVFERNEDGILAYKGKPLPERNSKMYDRMREMQTGGIDKDVFTIWLKQCREAGVSPWISVRMNDVHGADDDDGYMMCDLWKQHHEFWLNTYYGKNWNARQLDYAHPEVRKLYMDVIAELLDRYDCDGIELDWMRFCQVFRYGHEIDDAPILTEFIREVRRRCDEKAAAVGHKVGVAVRVPPDPRDAYGRGFDVEAWLDEGLVDIVTPTVFFCSNWDDVPVHIWRKIIGNRALLTPCVEAGNQPSPPYWPQAFGAPFDYALANLYYARGADGIYTFNHFGNNVEHYKRLANPALNAAQIRRTLLSYNDTSRPGYNYRPLPITVDGGFQQLRLNIGTRPEPGRNVQLIVATENSFPDGKVPEVRLNGVLLPKGNHPGGYGYPQRIKQYQCYAVPAGTLTTEGNVIDIRYPHGGSVTVDWVELYIGAAK